MFTPRKKSWLALAASVVSIAIVGWGAAPAYADGISIVGDTNQGVKAKVSVNDSTVKKGVSVTGSSQITFYFHVLGIPLPNTGFYVNSLPWSVTARPTLVSADHLLNSNTYQKFYNSSTKAYAWEVHGSADFTGDMTVNIKGKAKADAKGSGYVYAGTYTCQSWTGYCTNANAIQLLKVS